MDNEELQKLRLWLDSELSINHAYYWAILGAIIGGKFWWIAGAGIAVSVIYAIRRASRLPTTYLSIKCKNYRKPSDPKRKANT